MFVATDSFDTYLYIQTLFQMHLLQSYQSSTDIENQTNVSLVPFHIGGGPEAVVYLEVLWPFNPTPNFYIN